MAETPLTLGSKAMDAICMLFIMVPLASLSDYSFISKVSGLGTFVILSVIVAIGCYGLSLNGLTGFSRNMMDEESFWPKDFSSFSSWYGIVACKSCTARDCAFVFPFLFSNSTLLYSWFWYSPFYIQSTGINGKTY